MEKEKFKEMRNRIMAIHQRAIDESKNKEIPWSLRNVYSNMVSAYSHVLNIINEYEA